MKIDRSKLGRGIVSVLLATLLWLGLQLQGQTARRISVPLDFEKIPEGLVVADPGAETIQLTLRGVPARMARVDPEAVRIVLDLSKVEVGSTKFFINENRIEGLSAGLEIEEITPYAVSVRIEPLLEREVQIEAVPTGQVAENFRLETVRVTPERVRFRGPRGLGTKLTKLSTTKINVDGLSASETRKAEIAGDERVLPFLSQRTVEVEIHLEEKQIERLIKAVRVEPLAPPGMRVRLTPPQVDLSVTGPVSKVQDLWAESFEIQAEARSYGPGSHRKQELRLTFRIRPPREGVLFEYEPKLFDIFVAQ